MADTKPHKKRILFDNKYSNLNDQQYKHEMLYAQHVTAENLKKIKTNTEILIWCLIIIPIIISVITFTLLDL